MQSPGSPHLGAGHLVAPVQSEVLRAVEDVQLPTGVSQQGRRVAGGLQQADVTPGEHIILEHIYIVSLRHFLHLLLLLVLVVSF